MDSYNNNRGGRNGPNGNSYNGNTYNGNSYNGNSYNGGRYGNGGGNGYGNGWNGSNGEGEYLPALREPVVERNGALGVTDVRDVLEIIFKRKRVVLSSFLCIAVPIIYVAASNPPSFVATGKILIKSERVESTVAPGEDPRPLPARVNPATVNSEVQVLKSNELFRDVANRLARNGSSGSEKPTSPEVLARALASAVKVAPIRDSNVIQVTYTSRVPELAVETLNAVLDGYIDYHARVHSSPRVTDFYRRQLVEKLAKLKAAEAKLLRYETTHDIVSAKQELANHVDRLAALESQRREVILSVGALKEEVAQYEAALAGLPESEATEKRLVVNPAWEQAVKRLRYSQNRLERLRLRYTENHRLVREVKERAEDAEREVSQTERYVLGSEVVAKNPVRGDLMQRLSRARVELGTAEAKVALVEEQLRKYREELGRLSRRGAKAEALKNRVEELRQSWDLFRRKAEEAQIAEAMDQEQLVNVTIMERPQLPLPRVPTLGTVMMAVAVVGALAAGIVLAFLLEFLKRQFRREPDLERYLGVPALGSVREF